ncbi:hypothetical protein OIU85_022527 [Salix viminalis]|uniref:Uncharacterized protein n=1 Tax=Salix viminalis TaxID=40686 RepID=A0A9Q0Z7X8_SALVM|nr:hypothetical protein OIU85_022527 [Salix viminalis]
MDELRLADTVGVILHVIVPIGITSLAVPRAHYSIEITHDPPRDRGVMGLLGDQISPNGCTLSRSVQPIHKCCPENAAIFKTLDVTRDPLGGCVNYGHSDLLRVPTYQYSAKVVMLDIG